MECPFKFIVRGGTSSMNPSFLCKTLIFYFKSKKITFTNLFNLHHLRITWTCNFMNLF